MIVINENNYKDEVLNKDKVLIDFNATWCGPCRMLGPILEEYSETSTIPVCSVDVDNNPNLAKEFNIYSIPCLVLMEKGKETKRNVGLIDMDEIKDFVGE